MADERLIPNRPNPDESKIPAADKDMIAYMVAFSISNQKAFALWHPEFLDSSGKLNKTGRAACTQFFNYAKNREYADAYKATLAEFLERKDAQPVTVTDIDGSRKDNALKTFVNRALTLMERGEDLDPETVKLIADIAVKLKLIKEEQEEQEKPRRYIPERCSSCSYRCFVESNIEGGKIINECDYCRARKFAEENGWHYDPTKNLDLPEELTNKK